jgi:hypothetical protein
VAYVIVCRFGESVRLVSGDGEEIVVTVQDEPGARVRLVVEAGEGVTIERPKRASRAG